MPQPTSHSASRGAPPAATRSTSASLFKQAAFPLSIVMLVGWAVWTFAFDPAPGWVHMLLTVGVFLLIWAIVARDDTARAPAAPRDTR